MAWPTPQDYNEAIQSPRLSFADPELQSGTPELTALGLPRPITGNFASVYRLHCGKRDWAVRCFFREYADMQQRYAAISSHLGAAGLPYTVGFEFLARGIKVRGQWYPVLKMEWVEGELLNSYVERHLGDPESLRRLAEGWLRMAQALRDAGVAHGDLQHGNVLVVNGALKLVDYDGMFVPTLTATFSHEIGHQNYQHPKRTGSHFGPWIDHFSAWVIYLSLLGTAEDPSLWSSLPHDECLLFRRVDFDRPASSVALATLGRHREERVRELTDRFRDFLALAPDRIPPLEPDEPVKRRIGTVTRGGLPRQRGRQAAGPVQSTAPAWLATQLQPAAALPAFETVRAGRVVAGVAFVGLVCEVMLGMAVLASFVITGAGALGIVALGLLVLGVCFWSESSSREARALRHRERAERRALRGLTRTVRRLETRMLQEARRQEARRQKAGADLERIEERDRRRRKAMEAALHEMSAVLAGWRDEVEEWHRAESASILEALRARHVQDHLRRTSLRHASLAELGWQHRTRLWLGGLRTAADVTSERVEVLKGVGNRPAAAVLRWRAQVEQEARRTMPRALPTVISEPMLFRYGTLRRRIDFREQRLQVQYDAVLEALADVSRGKQACVEAAFSRSVREAQARRALREDEIADVRRHEPVHHWRLGEAQRELVPYRRISFGHYLVTCLAHPAVWPAGSPAADAHADTQPDPTRSAG